MNSNPGLDSTSTDLPLDEQEPANNSDSSGNTANAQAAKESHSTPCLAMHRSGFPDAPFPPQDLYQRLGEAKIAAVIRRQHELMWHSDIRTVFGSDPVAFERIITHSVHYFIEMFGGPKLFTSERGEPRLGRRHKHLQLTPYHRDVWLNAMRQALQENAVPQKISELIWQWVVPLSMRFLSPRIKVEELSNAPFMTDNTHTTTNNPVNQGVVHD